MQAPRRPILTTQLYFPDEPVNGEDLLFSPDLIMRIGEDAPVTTASFDFVLDIS